MLISKVDFSGKNIVRDTGIYFIMIKGLNSSQRYISNAHAPNNRASKFTKYGVTSA